MRFDVESWIWYAFAMGIIVARLISRTLLFGSPKGLQYDDWIMGIFIATCYTVLIVMTNIEAKAQSNLLPPNFDMGSLTPQDISDREYGSKIVIVVEQMQIAVIWACKSCLLILYHRLTRMVASKENVAIKLLAVYVALGFVVMEILYFAAWCRPFRQYYAVPTQSTQCNALTNHRITNAFFNISSDLIMLCIALPMFIRSLLPLKRKLILCFIFSLGLFVILAAILNKYYSFSNPYETDWIFWYAREASTAILVANLPFTWTLLRKLFNVGAFDEDHPPPPTYHSSRTAGGRRTARVHNTTGTISHSTDRYLEGGSNGTKTTSHSMSLIGSICAGKQTTNTSSSNPSTLTNPPSRGDQTSSTSQTSQNGLLVQAIAPHDFAPPPTTASSDPYPDDLESGPHAARLSPDTSIPLPALPPPATMPAAMPRRPVTPNSRLHFSVDGTGGFFANGRVTSPSPPPRRVHLRPQTASSQGSGGGSVAPPGGRRPSVTPSLTPSARSCASAGGGRSARDRKMRRERVGK